MPTSAPPHNGHLFLRSCTKGAFEEGDVGSNITQALEDPLAEGGFDLVERLVIVLVLAQGKETAVETFEGWRYLGGAFAFYHVELPNLYISNIVAFSGTVEDD
jgi:hypothetical protein